MIESLSYFFSELFRFILTHPFSTVNTIASAIVCLYCAVFLNAVKLKLFDPYCLGYISVGAFSFFNVLGPFMWGYNHAEPSEVGVNIGLALMLHGVVTSKGYMRRVELKDEVKQE